MYIRFFLIVALFCTFTTYAYEVKRIRRHIQKPVSPTKDSFYVPKEGWEKAKPGTILASRKIQAGFTERRKIHLDGAYQLLYRTSGVDDKSPSFSVTTVLVPKNARTNKLVMVMPYEDSNFVDCAPSYKIQLGAPNEVNPIQSVEELMWTSILNDGWILTLPDHQGPLSAFSSSFIHGHASLDALRATLNFDTLKLQPDDPIVGIGYSGGAMAGGWAASLHDSYASELNVVGWALGGTPSNLTGTFRGVNGGLFAGFSVAGIAGLVDSYPEVNDYIGSVITPAGNDALQYTREHCMIGIVVGLQNVNMTLDSFVSNGNTLLTDEKIAPLLNKLTMGTEERYTPKAPVYMYHARNDEIIPFERANQTANTWCNNGANILFQDYTSISMGHVSTEVMNTPFVLKFIRDRMSGVDFVKGCQWKSDLNPLWEPDILGARLIEVFNSLLNVLGAQVGRTDEVFKESIKQRNFTKS